MKLFERILVAMLLPKEGSYADLIVAQDVLKKVNLTQEEIKKYEVASDEKGVKWNAAGSKAKKKIEFSELEEKLIAEQLKKKEEEKKLGAEMLELYKKFVLKQK
jgi:transposase